MSILLEAEHLTKIFTQRGKNPFKAVNDVSFTLKKGETLGIVGQYFSIHFCKPSLLVLTKSGAKYLLPLKYHRSHILHLLLQFS